MRSLSWSLTAIFITALIAYAGQLIALHFYAPVPLLLSPEKITLFFTGFSFFSILFFFAARKISFDNAGFIFIATSMIKMVVSFFFAHPILENSDGLTFEKINFLAVFILFLAVETTITTKILNNKQ